MILLEKLLPWGPVFFGVLIFAPMWAAVMDASGITLPYDVSNIVAMLVLGFGWGSLAKLRGRWL
jgi:hypothetical protein